MKKGQLLVIGLIVFAVLCIPIPTGVRADDPPPTLSLNPNYVIAPFGPISVTGMGYSLVGPCTLGSDPGMKEGTTATCNTDGLGGISGTIDVGPADTPGTYIVFVVEEPTAKAFLYLYSSAVVTTTSTETTTATSSTDTTVTTTHTATSTTTLDSTLTSTSTLYSTTTNQSIVTSTTTIPVTQTSTTTAFTTVSGTQTIYTSTILGILTSYYFTATNYGTTTTFFPIAVTTSYGVSTTTVYTGVDVATVTESQTHTEQYTTTVGGVSTAWSTQSANTTLYQTVETTTYIPKTQEVTGTITVATVTATKTEQPPPPTQDMTGIYVLAGLIVGVVVLVCLWHFEMLPEMPDFVSGIGERLGGMFRRKKPPEEEEETVEAPPPIPRPEEPKAEGSEGQT